MSLRGRGRGWEASVGSTKSECGEHVWGKEVLVPERRAWTLESDLLRPLGIASPLWASVRWGQWQHLPHRAVQRRQELLPSCSIPSAWN